MPAKPYKVHLYGVDDPGSVKAFDSLDDVRTYLKDRLEYWDGRTAGHSDYMRYSFEGFTMRDIGAQCDDGWVVFNLPWPPPEPADPKG